MVKERERGTIEQLLMSPASTTEIIIAKMRRCLFCCADGHLAIAVMRIVFGIPFRGNVFLVISGAALCILCGISIGTVIATFTQIRAAGAADAFFRQPAALFAVRRVQSGRSDAELAAAADGI